MTNNNDTQDNMPTTPVTPEEKRSFFTRKWVLITAPIVAGVLLLGIGGSVGYAVGEEGGDDRGNHSQMQGSGEHHGSDHDGAGKHGGMGQRGEMGDRPDMGNQESMREQGRGGPGGASSMKPGQGAEGEMQQQPGTGNTGSGSASAPSADDVTSGTQSEG
jgi:hypothetical protein